MGRHEPFELKYVAIGNEDCGKTYYRGFFTFLCDLIIFLLSIFVAKWDCNYNRKLYCVLWCYQESLSRYQNHLQLWWIISSARPSCWLLWLSCKTSFLTRNSEMFLFVCFSSLKECVSFCHRFTLLLAVCFPCTTNLTAHHVMVQRCGS